MRQCFVEIIKHCSENRQWCAIVFQYLDNLQKLLEWYSVAATTSIVHLLMNLRWKWSHYWGSTTPAHRLIPACEYWVWASIFQYGFSGAQYPQFTYYYCIFSLVTCKNLICGGSFVNLMLLIRCHLWNFNISKRRTDLLIYQLRLRDLVSGECQLLSVECNIVYF